LKKRIEVVKNCRNIGKKDMKFNARMPKMRVDPESYVSLLQLRGYVEGVANRLGRWWKRMAWCAKQSLLSRCL